MAPHFRGVLGFVCLFHRQLFNSIVNGSERHGLRRHVNRLNPEFPAEEIVSSSSRGNAQELQDSTVPDVLSISWTSVDRE